MLKANKKLNIAQLIAVAVAVLIVVVLPWVGVSNLVLHYVIMMCVYMCMGQAWNLLGGLTGLFSLGHATFYGIGAYAVSAGMSKGGLPFPVCILIGVALNALMGFIIGIISARLSGFFFIMSTIALGQVARTFALQMGWLTGSSLGQAITRPTIERVWFVYVIAAMAIIYSLIFIGIRKSRTGSMFVSIRENENLARSLGVSSVKYKTLASALSAVLCGLIGSFICYYVLSVDPASNLASTVSNKIVMVTLIGGSGTVWGPVLGSVLILLEEVLRGQLGSTYAPLTNIVFGIILIIFMLFCPGGILSLFGRKKKSKKAAAASIEEMTEVEEEAVEEKEEGR